MAAAMAIIADRWRGRASIRDLAQAIGKSTTAVVVNLFQTKGRPTGGDGRSGDGDGRCVPCALPGAGHGRRQAAETAVTLVSQDKSIIGRAAP